MPRVVHFELPAADPLKVAAFYETVFGWTFTRWNEDQEYWLIRTGDDAQPGIHGGLSKPSHPGQPVVNILDVPSVDAYVASIEAAGGSIAVPKMAVPGVGWLAYFHDPAGNLTGIMQFDEAAA